MTTTPKRYYDALAHNYDWFLGSWEELASEQMRRLLPWLRKHEVVTVLDCACGTGLQVIPLAREGFDVVGSDLSQEMLEACREKCRAADVVLPLIQSDICDLRRTVRQTFDAVVCMGNVLPHFLAESEVREAVANMYAVLNDGGLLVIEMRNYDVLYANRTRFVPFRINAEEDGRRVSVVYVFDYLDEGYLRANVLFIIQEADGNVHLESESVDYRPILGRELRQMLEAVGFTEISIEPADNRMYCTGIKPKA